MTAHASEGVRLRIPLRYISRGERPKPPAYEEDVGIDIIPDYRRTIAPGENTFLQGTFEVEMPIGYFGLVLPRSSASNAGLHVFTGVIDGGYTGLIGARVQNLSSEPYYVGARAVAQLVIQRAYEPYPVEVMGFRMTQRGNQGWGSSDG